MYILALVTATVLLMMLTQGPRRLPGEPLDWSRRRRWWRRRWMFPDDR